MTEIFINDYSLPKKHGKSHAFYDFVQDEWHKCISGKGNYDPFAVCVHVRVKIENCAYSKIIERNDQLFFLTKCNGTSKKLDFAESIGIQVPEACFLLGVVYNDALHRKEAIEQSSSIALKLRNLGLQSIMKQAIKW